MNSTLKSLFFIDDDDAYLERFKKIMPTFGWMVVAVSTVEEARKILKATSFDCYLVDFSLRGKKPKENQIDGNELFQELKTYKTFRALSPVVFYSAIVRARTKFDGRGSKKNWRESFDYYNLPRPISLPDISLALNEIMTYHHSR